MPDDPRVHQLVLPFNTGKGRTDRLPPGNHQHWYGARVMAAAGCLVNNEYAMFLDEDNWLRADHVASCIETIESRQDSPYHAVFALRTINRQDGSVACRDDCESLGLFSGMHGMFVDTSCYFYRTDFMMDTSHLWLSGWGADRRFFNEIIGRYGKDCFAGTGRYTVHYRLSKNPGAPTEVQFKAINAAVYAQVSGQIMPWAIE
jgi:hypothetical protein